MNRLEKVCEFVDRCPTSDTYCSNLDPLECKHYWTYVARERLDKIRENEGKDYIDLMEKYEE